MTAVSQRVREKGRMSLPLYLARIYPYLLNGMKARQIAIETGLAVRTVQAYSQEIYEFYGVHSRKELK